MELTVDRGTEISEDVLKQVVSVPELEDATEFGYSQCVTAGRLVFLAGQCGVDSNQEVVSLGFADQARQALERVRLGVEAAGGTLDDIVTMTVFITDVRLGRLFTEIRREYFTERFPASALIGVSALMPVDAMVEIQATAVLGSGHASRRPV